MGNLGPRKLAMIKTLRITSIVVAVFGVGLLIFSGFFGFRGDPEIEKFLNAPSVIDKFQMERSKRAKGGRKQESELVKQAGLFAKYIDPPAAGAVQRQVERPGEVPKAESPQPMTKPKFTVLATVFNESDPQQSVAWIDAPGKGRVWVRQSAEFDHLTIEQIRDGVVVAKGSKGTFELLVERLPHNSHVIGPESASGSVGAAIQPQVPVTSSNGAVQAEVSVAAEKALAELETTTGGGLDNIDAGSGDGDTEQEQLDPGMRIFAKLAAITSGEFDEIDTGSDVGDTEAEQQAVTVKIFTELEAIAAGAAGTGSNEGEPAETAEQDGEFETEH